MQDCKDGSELQFIKFDVVTGGQEIKIATLVEFSLFLDFLVNFCFLPSLLAIFFPFQDNKASLKLDPG